MKSFAFAAVALCLFTTPAFADHADQKSMNINVTDLDLATPEGRQILDNRIKWAARRVCEIGTARTGTRLPYPDSVKCLQEARASAELQLASLQEQRQRRA